VTITTPPEPPPPPGPPSEPDVTSWVDKWFRMNITIDEAWEFPELGLLGEGRKAKAYLHIQSWDPATGIFDATLYQYDRAGDVAVAWVWMEFQVISGTVSDFQSWSQFMEDPTTAFTSQIKGKWAKGHLVTARDFYFRASLYYARAQWSIFSTNDEKRALMSQCGRCYDKAIEYAQSYLDRAMPGTIAAEPHAFYGYYTLHTERNGQITGMLSVNGYTGQVWYHDWHGPFISMSETEAAHRD